MPKLWHATIEQHRQGVREAILETTVSLVAAHGLRAVTMAQIAEETGIGRATLYKYFPDVEAILAAWHERQVAGHLGHLAALATEPDDATRRLETVLGAYALMTYRRPHGTDVAALLHRGEHVAEAHRHLTDLICELVTEAAASGKVRDDIAPNELARYCLHALAAATGAPSEDAVRRLVGLVLSGLQPPHV